MPKFQPNLRLSIIVPIGRDLAAFERTLISVLENRPAGCEVLVVHDGKYDDPFKLCDEVRFVIAHSNGLVDLVSTAAAETSGQFVHVLADGVQATLGWTEEALEPFEQHDVGVVAPVIRHAGTQRILAAGWCDGGDRLCKTAHRGCEAVDADDSRSFLGAYLQASFWRRELLCSLTEAFSGCHSVEAAYAFEHLIRAAGWRCLLAADSTLLSESSQLPWDTTSLGRGKRLRAIRNHFSHHGILSESVSAATGAVLANALRPRYLIEAIGQAMAPFAAGQVAKQLRPDAVTRCREQARQVNEPQPNSYAA